MTHGNARLLTYRKYRGDGRTTLAIEKAERIWSPLERRVFFTEQKKRICLVDDILKELAAEEGDR